MDVIWSRLAQSSDVIFVLGLIIMGLVYFIRYLIKKIDKKDALITEINEVHLQTIEARNKEDRDYNLAFFRTADNLTDAVKELKNKGL